MIMGTAMVSFMAYQSTDYSSQLRGNKSGGGGKKRKESNSDANADYAAYLTEWDKSYDADEEFIMRQEIFLDSFWQVENTNQLNTRTDEINFALNRFSDWTDEEYDDLLLSGTYIPGSPVGPPVPDWPVQDDTLAASVNWVDENVVGDVRDQWYDGSACVSNYAIASVAALESAHAIESNLTTETT